jgi:hypothetical protein
MANEAGTITFPNSSCVALWKYELLGQMSDGMWENSRPCEHWKFWSDLDVQIGAECRVVCTNSYACRKTAYNFAALYNIVGERMLAIGRMGKLTTDSKQVNVAAYMPPTIEEFRASKASGKWRYDFCATYMECLSDELVKKFYATTYTMNDLKRDIATIKAVMLTVRYGTLDSYS